MRFGWAYDSWASPSVLSSILMSLSSLDSKTSRHSRHSTNSASSSRLTICTRGCLQGCLLAFWGCENGFEVINPEASPSLNAEEPIRGNFPVFYPRFATCQVLRRYWAVNFLPFGTHWRLSIPPGWE